MYMLWANLFVFKYCLEKIEVNLNQVQNATFICKKNEIKDVGM